MKLFNFDTKKEKATYSVSSPVITINEKLKGEVENSQNFFKQNDVEPHPFDYAICEGLSKEFGLVNTAINKIVNNVWSGGFYTVCDDNRAKGVIDQWLEDVNFETIGRDWLKQALLKGFSPLELGGSKNQTIQGVKVLNANRVFAKRDKQGTITGYIQTKGKQISVSKNDVIEFAPFEIAHLNFNSLDECPYGYGMIYPNLNTINNFLKSQKDLHKLVSRKAGAPIIATLGTPVEPASPEDVEGFGSKLTYMNNQTEWAVGANVKIEALNMGDVGKNFETVIKNDFDLFMMGVQIPEVLLGKGNVPEGLAKVQMDDFQRTIVSIQAELERIIEEQIFKRILLSNGLQVHCELEWGTPDQEETNQKITQLNALLGNMNISSILKNQIENDLAKTLGYEIEISLEASVQKEVNAEGKETQETEEKLPIVPGQGITQKCNHTHIDEYYEGQIVKWR